MHVIIRIAMGMFFGRDENGSNTVGNQLYHIRFHILFLGIKIGIVNPNKKRNRILSNTNTERIRIETNTVTNNYRNIKTPQSMLLKSRKRCSHQFSKTKHQHFQILSLFVRARGRQKILCLLSIQIYVIMKQINSCVSLKFSQAH